MLSHLDWSSVTSGSSVDSAWGIWKSLFLSVVEKHVPSKLIGRARTRPPWITPQLTSLIKEKHAAWRLYKRSGSPDDLASFRQIRNRVTASLRSAERHHLTLHCDIHLAASTSSIKNFWSYVKRISGKVKGSSIPDLLTVSPDG